MSGSTEAKPKSNILIHAVCFAPPAKVVGVKPDFQTSLKRYLVKDAAARQSALDLIGALDTKASAFYAALENPHLPTEAFDAASSNYLALLSAFIDAPFKSHKQDAHLDPLASLEPQETTVAAPIVPPAPAAAAAALTDSKPSSATAATTDPNPLFGGDTTTTATAPPTTYVDAPTAPPPPPSAPPPSSPPPPSTDVNRDIHNLLGNNPRAPATVEELRYAVRFNWIDALGSNTSSSSSKKGDVTIRDMAFEATSVALASALWRMRSVYELCTKDQETGLNGAATTQAYKLLRESAGAFQEIVSDWLPMLTLYNIKSVDYQTASLQSLASCCLADAQSITVLRAIQKGNQPSLISSLARDTADLYATALASAQTVGMSEKYKLYLQYKQTLTEAYAHIFNGITLWKAEKVGDGLKSGEMANKQAEEARRLVDKYDRTSPSTLYAVHREHDQAMYKIVNDSVSRMEKEASNVYFQTKSQVLPALPSGQRLVSPLEPPLEAPSAEVAKTTEVVQNGAAGFHNLPPPPIKKPQVSAPTAGGCLRCLCFSWCCGGAVKTAVEADEEKVKKHEEKVDAEESKKSEEVKKDDVAAEKK